MSIELFLQPCEQEEEGRVKEFFITKKFKHPDGKPVLWKIRKIKQGEVNEIAKRSTYELKDGRRLIDKRTDYEKLSRLLVAHSVVFPDLTDAKLQARYKANSASECLCNMLEQGEYLRVVDAYESINDLSFSNDDEEDIEEAIKN
jgi:hypothetical protein